MDTLDIQAFETGFNYAVSFSLPLFGSLIGLGVLIFCVKKFFKL